ncbi:MAG: SdrD B-like domain-containing protein, partial [Pseudomonadota bacterium]
YLFDQLQAGSYQVRFNTVGDFVFTTASSQPAEAANNDSDADQTTGLTDLITLDIGETDLDIDAGLVDPGTAALGDTVFFDENGNGLLDQGEGLVEGALVELLDGQGNVLDSQLTGADGGYLFDQLQAGSYQVRFNTVGDFVFTTASSQPAEAANNDSDADQTTGLTDLITLDIGETDLDIDAGLVDPGTAALGDTVFFDENGNGLLDQGEGLVEGALVELLDGQGNVLDSQLTGADGGYLFDQLQAGSYQVRFNTVGDFVFTTASSQPAEAANNDSDADQTTGLTDLITLDIGETDLDIDAGLVAQLGSISGTYFCDENGNALDDTNEIGVANRDVTLLTAGTDGVFGTADDVVVATTTTDANGDYTFQDLEADTYAVNIRGSGFVTQDVDANASDDIDSDVDQATGTTDPIVLGAGEDIVDVDAGTTRFEVPDDGLLGIANLPFSLPQLGFNNDGTTTYDASSGTLSVDATALSLINEDFTFQNFLPLGSVRVTIDLSVDQNGDLIGGRTEGALNIYDDANGNGVFDQGETQLLTGDAIAFGFDGSGLSTDSFDTLIEIDGGTLAQTFDPIVGAHWSSEFSDFTGDFSVDFSGEAKGEVRDVDIDCI